jgi:hypothetical protein
MGRKTLATLLFATTLGFAGLGVGVPAAGADDYLGGVPKDVGPAVQPAVDAPESSGGDLPYTGSDLAGLALVGAGLVVVGLGLSGRLRPAR